MDNEQKPGHYDAVIADLRRRITQLQNTISVLEQLKAGGLPGVPDLGDDHRETAGSGAESPAPATGPGAFLGMSIADAARKLLGTQRRQMTTSEITTEIERGGVVLTSVDKINTVGSVLLRRFYNTGDIVRVSRGIWGLAEWYPGRKFQKGGGAKSDESAPKDSEEPQQESAGVGNEPGTEPDFQYDKPINFSSDIGEPPLG
jgi:hypothetical protein